MKKDFDEKNVNFRDFRINDIKFPYKEYKGTPLIMEFLRIIICIAGVVIAIVVVIPNMDELGLLAPLYMLLIVAIPVAIILIYHRIKDYADKIDNEDYYKAFDYYKKKYDKWFYSQTREFKDIFGYNSFENFCNLEYDASDCEGKTFEEFYNEQLEYKKKIRNKLNSKEEVIFDYSNEKKRITLVDISFNTSGNTYSYIPKDKKEYYKGEQLLLNTNYGFQFATVEKENYTKMVPKSEKYVVLPEHKNNYLTRDEEISLPIGQRVKTIVKVKFNNSNKVYSYELNRYIEEYHHNKPFKEGEKVRLKSKYGVETATIVKGNCKVITDYKNYSFLPLDADKELAMIRENLDVPIDEDYYRYF